MHNGLKFRDANGNYKSVSAEHPLPTTSGGGSSGGGGLTDAELRAAPLNVAPAMASGGNVKVTLAANVVSTLASRACKQVTVANPTDTDVFAVIGTVDFPVFARGYFTFFGLTNANAIALRSTEAGDVYVRWET